MVFRLGIFGVLIAALIAVMVFAYSLLNQSKHQVEQAVPVPQTEQILVAAQPLPAGSLLQPSQVASATIPVTGAPSDVLIDTPQNRASLTGSMVRTALSQGAPLLNSQVIHPGDHGFLAAVLAPGMRAVTVAVDNVTGANGLIWPGDNVDVLLTQSVSGVSDAKSIAAEVVLSNVRVIASGAQVVKDASTANNSVQTVTLEVTPEQASRCLVAINLGKLSLIVHSAETAPAGAEQAQSAPQQPVWAGDVSPALAATQPQVPAVSTVNVISSGATGEFKF
ncbi:Flp pilus assembly protein CpaB [Acidocella aromatica]|uniref:Pilus assembly protein CpaB n=1 Tax=Acidocella aromatica TaxID=1303579 RepID=A0A840V8Q3_9PROT|nr:Flp pilus assembly protein CpaB [Acidocella aromatica]MBB5372338.1 pilus assembly protein CpaB [Acidocella aromatica]